MNSNLAGYRVVVVPPAKHSRKRSWWERLFSWTPFQEWEVTYQEMLTDGQCAVDQSKMVIYANAATAKALDETLERKVPYQRYSHV